MNRARLPRPYDWFNLGVGILIGLDLSLIVWAVRS